CGGCERCEGAKGANRARWCGCKSAEAREMRTYAPLAPHAPYAPCLELVPQCVLHAAAGAAVAGRERSVVGPERVGTIREHRHVADVHSHGIRDVEDVPTEPQLLVLRPRHRPGLGEAEVDVEVAIAAEHVAQARLTGVVAAEVVHRG